jgi:hypothetical protein
MAAIKRNCEATVMFLAGKIHAKFLISIPYKLAWMVKVEIWNDE